MNHFFAFQHPRAAMLATFAASLCAVAPTLVQAQDRVRLISGSELQGEIISISPNGVEIENAAGAKQVGIESVKEVLFGGEPDSLRNARSMLLNRQDGPGALDELAKIEKSELEGVKDAVQTELLFLKVAATARKAISSGEKLDEAQKLVSAFLAKYPKSHHLYRMQELLGDLLARGGKTPEAVTAYSVLGQGPPALRVRAATVKARLYVDQQNYAEAIKEFEAAEQVPTTEQDAASLRQKREARLGRATCLTRLGKPKEAIALVDEVIKPLDAASDKDLLARVYNVLGEAQRGVDGKSRDALISFLTVDLVYNTVAEDHARALFNLVDLWEQSKNPERAREARQSLESTYPDSTWARKLAAGGKAS